MRILVDEPITFWDSAPAMLQQLVPYWTTSHSHARLRLVFLSGDWIPVTLPDAVRQAFPQAEVVSLGGATEAVIWSNFYRIGDVDRAWTSIPTGDPFRTLSTIFSTLGSSPCRLECRATSTSAAKC